MEKERTNQKPVSRIIQQKQNHSINGIVDNRPYSSFPFFSNPTVQRVSEEDEETMQGKFDSSVQRMEDEDEEPLQGKFESPVQRASEEDEDTLQGKFDKPIQKKNDTGMPDNLKAGIESLSGFSMDDVRVHYNSSKPATVQALAYTQGTDIHVAPGQEKHIPHEAWHVVQQMSGRVSPTTNINGIPVNNNVALEHEADVMGEKAVAQRFVHSTLNKNILDNSHQMNKGAMQLLGKWENVPNQDYYYWTTERSGVQWYCNSNELMWYKIVDESKVPTHLLSGYKYYQDVQLPRIVWNSIWKSWASSKHESGAPGLGMEIELDRGKEKFKTSATKERPMEEKDFKAIEVYRIVNDIVKVTFDTATGYDKTQKQPLTIELVFDHTKIPLESDLDAIFENLGCEIMDLTYDVINKKKNTNHAFDRIEMEESQEKVVDSEELKFNIHVTIACPLEKIYPTKGSKADIFVNRFRNVKVLEGNKETIKNSFKKLNKTEQTLVRENLREKTDLLNILNEVTESCRPDVDNFFALLNSIKVDTKNNDPKQKMSVMNRTSFGKIFFLMDKESKKQVIDNFNEMVNDFSYTGTDLNTHISYIVSKENLYAYLCDIYEKDAYQNTDPSYLAAKAEKFGISELGDSTTMVNNQECPIFEFRMEFSNKSISNFGLLAKLLKERFWGSVEGF